MLFQIETQRPMQSVNDLDAVKAKIESATESLDMGGIVKSMEQLKNLAGVGKKYQADKESINILKTYSLGGPTAIIGLYADKLDLNYNEKTTLDLANDIGLIDRTTRKKLFREGLENTLTDFQKLQIKSVQIGLKLDGKYMGEIDGIFGSKSTIALEGLIIENSPVIEEAKILLKDLEMKSEDQAQKSKLSNPGMKENSPGGRTY